MESPRKPQKPTCVCVCVCVCVCIYLYVALFVIQGNISNFLSFILNFLLYFN